MSSNQKMLKVMSLLAVLAALGMAVWTGMSLTFANNSTGLLLALCVAVPAVLDAILGVWGVKGANKPVRIGVYFAALAWLTLVLNVVSVVVYLLLNAMVWPSLINLVLVAAYVYFMRGVRTEALR